MIIFVVINLLLIVSPLNLPKSQWINMFIIRVPGLHNIYYKRAGAVPKHDKEKESEFN